MTVDQKAVNFIAKKLNWHFVRELKIAGIKDMFKKYGLGVGYKGDKKHYKDGLFTIVIYFITKNQKEQGIYQFKRDFDSEELTEMIWLRDYSRQLISRMVWDLKDQMEKIFKKDEYLRLALDTQNSVLDFIKGGKVG